MIKTFEFEVSFESRGQQVIASVKGYACKGVGSTQKEAMEALRPKIKAAVEAQYPTKGSRMMEIECDVDPEVRFEDVRTAAAFRSMPGRENDDE